MFDEDPPPVEMVDCPDCGMPAAVADRFCLGSTDGPIEHLTIFCVLGHGYMLPTEMLARYTRRG